MSFPWRSARTAWVLLIGAGAVGLHLSNRVRSLEEEVGALGRKGAAQADRALRLEAEHLVRSSVSKVVL